MCPGGITGLSSNLLKVLLLLAVRVSVTGTAVAVVGATSATYLATLL